MARELSQPDSTTDSSEVDRGVNEIHFTEDGQIHLCASPDKDGGWRARRWGTQLSGARHFKTVEEATLARSIQTCYLIDSVMERCLVG